MRYNSLDDMPPHLREKVKRQIIKEGREAEFGLVGKAGSGKRSKYGNCVTYVGEVKFDSAREAERYTILMMKLHEGEIEKLKLQPEFTITESYRLPDGRLVKAQRYRADFSYVVKATGEYVVEDVKCEATKTQVFINKAKLLYEKYGIIVALIE